MRSIDVITLKNLQLDILDYFSDFCKKHQLSYWIDCGSLLGAIRHKGYIPWDDDIDVGMLRPDYDQCMRLFNKESKRYKFFSIENNKNMNYAMGKVLDTNTVLYEPNRKGNRLCVYIDVFVYDNAPDNDKSVRKMFRKKAFLQKLSYLQMPYTPSGNIFRKMAIYIIKGILKTVPKHYFIEKIVKNAKSYVSENTTRVGDFVGDTKCVFDKRILNNFIEVEFEGKYYKAPVGYDEWLTIFYGDYRKLPPLEKQISHHQFEAYMLDDKSKRKVDRE